MIEYIKNSQWIFWTIAAIGTIISCFFLIRNWISKMNESNRTIYNDTLVSKYYDLFEFKKSDGSLQLQLVTNDYNPIEISRFCNQVKEFKRKGNSFRGVFTNFLFNRLYKIASKIDLDTDGLIFSIGTLVSPDDTYFEYYNKNKENFELLKKRFSTFYLKIFDNL